MRRILSDEMFAAKLSRNAVKVAEDFSAERVCAEWERYLKEVAEG
jgi:hypothetical protein